MTYVCTPTHEYPIKNGEGHKFTLEMQHIHFLLTYPELYIRNKKQTFNLPTFESVKKMETLLR